jgi:hypothetical protein
MDLYPSVVRRASRATRLFPGAPGRSGEDHRRTLPGWPLHFYVTEGEKDGTDVRLFGYCVLCARRRLRRGGYTMLSELQNLRVRGLTMERDLDFPIATRTVADALARAA